MYIYKTTNTLNGRFYIGSKKARVEDSQSYLGSGKALLQAIRKYGKEVFRKEILELCDDYDTLKQREIEILTKMDAAGNADCYNIHNNFSGGYNKSAYTKSARKKIGKANAKRVLSDCQKSCSWMSTSEANAKKHPPATCCHCGKTANKTNIVRWHNDNCKNRPELTPLVEDNRAN
jgi:Putative endonuclease segE, GIY-YIG domain